ncbi:MAG: site-specific integrase [Candidatus Zixiibacteriota bacterium]|nr:MAG: site-specific integrase [candidate division Zixibacteria bacterium]
MAIVRQKTKYIGVYFREVQRVGGPGLEKVYYIVFKKDGKVYEEKVGRQYADDMTPARAASIRADRIENKRKSRKQVRQELENERLLTTDRWTLDRLWDEYKAQNQGAKSFFTDENRYKKHLKAALGNREPGTLTPIELDQFRTDLTRKGLAAATIRNIMELLRRLIHFAQKRQLCPVPAYLGELPTVNNQKTEDLTPQQMAKLWEVLEAEPNRTAATLMKFALLTGMRRGELFKLRWTDIENGRGFIHLRDPKNGQDQKIPLSQAARQVLDAIPRTSEFVFPGRDGRQRVDINKAVTRIKKAAGLPEDFRPLHGLRHAFASLLASSGKVDMYTLQKLLTHKSPTMTQRYAHMRDEALKRASNLVDELITDDLKAGKG